MPACVMVCPTKARHFGDLGDPDSRRCRELVAERGGCDLMPELGYKPVNKYLPPRRGRMAPRRRRRRAAAAERRAAAGDRAAALGRPAAVALTRIATACIPRSRSSSSPPLRAPASRCCLLLGLGVPLGLLPASRWLRLCRRWRLAVAARRRRAGLLGLPSRPARAGLARLLAMALVVAVARGRAVGR